MRLLPSAVTLHFLCERLPAPGAFVVGQLEGGYQHEAALQVQAAGVPFCFVTNNGMESEAQRAARLSASLGLPVPAANMVLNHSGLQEAGASCRALSCAQRAQPV
jgi:hypothetical protein